MGARVIVTGGGTGGHLFPGIALASGLQSRLPGCRILFIGTERHLDRKALADYDFEVDTIKCMGLKGMGWLHRLRSVCRLPGAVLEAGRILKRFQPQLVFGVGGYVTGPVLLAARLQRIPVCIHEQNSVPGLANRLASRLADRIFLSLPCSYRFPPGRTVLVGNPVRPEIITAGREMRTGKRDIPVVLVLGGSQGAHRVNRLVVEAAGILARGGGAGIRFIHQTGATDAESVRDGYAKIGVDAEVSDFFRDMAAIYRQADLVISRAGATTLAELAVMGLPALLIPYPHAADDHQRTNGEYYQAGGGATVMDESELSGTALAGAIKELLAAPDRLAEMGDRMREMGRPEAVARIIDLCLELMGKEQLAGVA